MSQTSEVLRRLQKVATQLEETSKKISELLIKYSHLRREAEILGEELRSLKEQVAESTGKSQTSGDNTSGPTS